MQIFDREQKKIEIEKAYEEAKSNYQKKIYEPSHDRFVRMERNLWIYFLTEPKKVLECIKEVQKKAAEKGSASFKSMNITLPKQNWSQSRKSRENLQSVNFLSFISFSEIDKLYLESTFAQSNWILINADRYKNILLLALITSFENYQDYFVQHKVWNLYWK